MVSPRETDRGPSTHTDNKKMNSMRMSGLRKAYFLPVVDGPYIKAELNLGPTYYKMTANTNSVGPAKTHIISLGYAGRSPWAFP
jgi:hypothetical protein